MARDDVQKRMDVFEKRMLVQTRDQVTRMVNDMKVEETKKQLTREIATVKQI
jgi:hypothetical protein